MKDSSASTQVQPKKRILIAEDDQPLLRLMCEHLQTCGYIVRSTTSGKEAITIIHKDPPDCLIIDNVLPNTMGFEVCQSVRSSSVGSMLPIILTSAFGPVDVPPLVAEMDPLETDDGEGESNAALSGPQLSSKGLFDLFLPKPFRLEDLENTVATLLDMDQGLGKTAREQRMANRSKWTQGTTHAPAVTARTTRERTDEAVRQQSISHELDQVTKTLKERIPLTKPSPIPPKKAVVAPPTGSPPGLPVKRPVQESIAVGAGPFGDDASPLPKSWPVRGPSMSLVQMLSRLLAEQDSGILKIKEGPLTRRLVMVKGIPAYSDTNTFAHSFGVFLHGQGHLDQEGLVAYEAAWKEKGPVSPDLLRNKTNLSDSRMVALTRDYVEHVLAALLKLPKDQYALTFLAAPELGGHWPDINVNPLKVVNQWIQESYTEVELAEALKMFQKSILVKTDTLDHAWRLIFPLIQLDKADPDLLDGIPTFEILRCLSPDKRASTSLLMTLLIFKCLEPLD